AIDHARLFHETQTRAEKLAALNELSTLLTSTLDLPEVLRLIMERIQDFLGVEASSLLLKDDQKDELVFRIGLGEYGTAVVGRRLKVGQGIAGWVFEHGAALIVPDVRQDRRFYEGVDYDTGFRTKSVLCVPLRTREKMIGVIQVLNSSTGRTFNQDDVNLLSAIAGHAATAIDHARLFHETQTRAEKLGALAEVSRAVTSSLDLQHVFELITRACSELLDSAVASLWTLEGDELILRAGGGVNSELWDRHFHLVEGLVGWIARQKEPVVIREFAEEPRITDKTWAFEEGLHAYAGFPLRVGNRCLGVLMVFRTSRQPFARDEVEFLSAFANQAAVVVDHAILHHEHQAHSANLERIVRDRTKEFRRKSQEMERANRTRSEFLVTICHELKSSLGGVVAFSQLLQQQPVGHGTEKQATYVANILSGARHLLAVINNILDITSVDAGKIELHREVMQVSTVLLDVLADIRPQAEAKGLQLAVDVKECRSALVADPLRVRQIVDNLLSNAVKVTPEGGRITVRARSHGEAVELSVSDTGIGIKAEDLPRLFEPFSHLDPTPSKPHEGTGLGLALSKQLLELHGGTIR
ncbi:MAG: GAF domain-containing protein, partial [Thermoplasmata archaeon]